MSKASPPRKATKATASPGTSASSFDSNVSTWCGGLGFRTRSRDEPQALVLRRERGRYELRPLAGLELEQRAAGQECRVLDHLQQLAAAREHGDERVVRQLGERVLVGRVVGEAVARRHLLLEAVDLRLRVGEQKPVFVFADDEVVARRVARISLLDGRPELLLVLRLRNSHDVLALILEVEPDEADLVAERGLHVLLPVELQVVLERGAEEADRLFAIGKLLEQLLDLLPLPRIRIGIDRDEGRRVRGDDLGAAGSGLIARTATREREGSGADQG